MSKTPPFPWENRFASQQLDCHDEGPAEIRVLLAVEPPLLRESLRSLIERQSDMQVVGETVLHPVSLLFAGAKSGANVAVLSCSVDEASGIATILFDNLPDICCLLVIDPAHEREGAVEVLRRVVVTERRTFPGTSLMTVIAAARAGAGEAGSHLTTLLLGDN